VAAVGRQRGHLLAEFPELARRDAEIVRRYKAGENLASIGAALDLTRQRVHQVVRDSGARMPWEYKCAVKECVIAPRSPNRYCRDHQYRLERWGDPLGVKPRLMDQHGTVASYKDGRCRCDLCRKANADQRLDYMHRTHPERRRNKRPSP
jgi:hypothetical protein